jgi:hypothetical protein
MFSGPFTYALVVVDTVADLECLVGDKEFGNSVIFRGRKVSVYIRSGRLVLVAFAFHHLAGQD